MFYRFISFLVTIVLHLIPPESYAESKLDNYRYRGPSLFSGTGRARCRLDWRSACQGAGLRHFGRIEVVRKLKKGSRDA